MRGSGRDRGRSRNGKKVVVIGAGLGGIAAAITVATEGFDVELFEKNDKIGGKLNVVEKNGYSFDLGPSIIILPHLFRRLFDRAGRQMEDYVELQELAPHWRSFFEDGTVIDLHPDMSQMERELEKLGEGADGYWEYMEYSRRMWKFSEESYLERGADGLFGVLKGYAPAAVVAGTDLNASMYDGVARHLKNQNLRDMLAFFIKYVGSSPYDAPGHMNLLAYSQMGYGLWYVKGGMYNLARGYQRLLEELGVAIHVDTEVTRLLRHGKEVRGVELADGSRVNADVVISNMEVIPAYKRLLGEKGLMMRRYEYMFEPAASGLVLHLGVDRQYPQLEHHNFFFSKDPRGFLDAIHRRKELPEDPTVYLVRATKTDPGLAPAGHDVIKALPHVPYIQKNPFTMSDYVALKDRVIDKLERMGLEDLRKHVVVEDMLVPDDLERMYYSNKGSIYGVVSDRRKNLSLKAPKASEKYRNLFFVGGSVNPGGGTCMVVLCGQNVGYQVAERYGK
jgi:diapolycopene oxygenase